MANRDEVQELSSKESNSWNVRIQSGEVQKRDVDLREGGLVALDQLDIHKNSNGERDSKGEIFEYETQVEATKEDVSQY